MLPEVYPTYIAWKIDLRGKDNVDQIISRSRGRRIHKALMILEASSYSFAIEDVTDASIDRFIPLYEQHLGGKENSTLFDVRGKLNRGMAEGKRYESISLWENHMFMGGLIYSVKAEELSVAYRIFPYKLTVKLPISCSYVAEKYLVDRALTLKKPQITHGKDRNVYGPHASIGLAEYKLNIGCQPHVSQVADNQFLPLGELSVNRDTFIFMGSKVGEPITRAILFTTQSLTEAAKTYTNLLGHTIVAIDIRPLS